MRKQGNGMRARGYAGRDAGIEVGRERKRENLKQRACQYRSLQNQHFAHFRFGFFSESQLHMARFLIMSELNIQKVLMRSDISLGNI